MIIMDNFYYTCIWRIAYSVTLHLKHFIEISGLNNLPQFNRAQDAKG